MRRKERQRLTLKGSAVPASLQPKDTLPQTGENVHESLLLWLKHQELQAIDN